MGEHNNHRPWVHRRAFFVTILFWRPENSRLQKRRSKELTDPATCGAQFGFAPSFRYLTRLLQYVLLLAFPELYSLNVADVCPRKKKKTNKNTFALSLTFEEKDGRFGGQWSLKKLVLPGCVHTNTQNVIALTLRYTHPTAVVCRSLSKTSLLPLTLLLWGLLAFCFFFCTIRICFRRCALFCVVAVLLYTYT